MSGSVWIQRIGSREITLSDLGKFFLSEGFAASAIDMLSRPIPITDARSQETNPWESRVPLPSS
jgi:hypothetical protein